MSWVAEDEAAEAEAEEEERAFYHVLDEDEARPDGEANSSNCCWLGILVLETFELYSNWARPMFRRA